VEKTALQEASKFVSSFTKKYWSDEQKSQDKHKT